MYAIVRTGGKQVKVEEGVVALVERIDAAVGDKVTLTPLLVASEDGLVSDTSALSAATVSAEVVGQVKADKVIVFKFQKRKGYKRTKGHRQPQTLLKITGISLGAGKPKAVKAATGKTEAKSKAAAKPVAAKPKASPRATARKAASKTTKPAEGETGSALAKTEAKPKSTMKKGTVSGKKPAVKAQQTPESGAKKPASTRPKAVNPKADEAEKQG